MWNSFFIIRYELLTRQFWGLTWVTGIKDIGTTGDLDWFSVSQLGGYAVAQWRPNGTGPKEGIKAFDIDMTNERHIYHTTQHGDLGVDAYGNEVIVEYGNQSEWDEDHSLYMARLDGGGMTFLFPYVNNRGIWGGHISTRNLDRPGWAYISEQCCSSNPVAPREMFAIKLFTAPQSVLKSVLSYC